WSLDESDRIYGLGSADTKLDFLCKLKALEEFRGIPFRHRVALVGTYGEEVGLLGAQALVDAGYFNFACGLIGEPSGLRPILAHKGLSVWDIRIDPTCGGPPPEERIEMMELVFGGTAAHASTPGLGENAITGALEFLARAQEQGRSPKLFSIDGGTASNVVPDRCRVLLGSEPLIAEDARRAGVQIEERGVCAGRPIGCVTILASVRDHLQDLDKRLGEKKEDLFKPPMSTMNVGRIASAEGVVRITFEVRPVPGLPLEELSETVGALEDTLSTLHPESVLQIHNLRSNPPMRDARDGRILGMALDTIAELGLPAEAATKATCTEAAVYSQMGIDAIVFGPGASEGNVHRPNEHNLLSECENAVAFYTRIIERLCV
ncbi:MAG: M20 family metallopeptidase, partial [Myxococcota bacterium]